jgi:hypothetical protein
MRSLSRSHELEIAAFIGLQNFAMKQRRVTTRWRRAHNRGDIAHSRRHLGFVDLNVDPASRHVQSNPIAIAHACERPTDGRLWGDMQDDGTERGSAHSRV